MTKDEAERICREMAHCNARSLSAYQFQHHMTEFVQALVTPDQIRVSHFYGNPPPAAPSVSAPEPKPVTTSKPRARKSRKG